MCVTVELLTSMNERMHLVVRVNLWGFFFLFEERHRDEAKAMVINVVGALCFYVLWLVTSWTVSHASLNPAGHAVRHRGAEFFTSIPSPRSWSASKFGCVRKRPVSSPVWSCHLTDALQDWDFSSVSWETSVTRVTLWSSLVQPLEFLPQIRIGAALMIFLSLFFPTWEMSRNRCFFFFFPPFLFVFLWTFTLSEWLMSPLQGPSRFVKQSQGGKKKAAFVLWDLYGFRNHNIYYYSTQQTAEIRDCQRSSQNSDSPDQKSTF